MEIGSEFCSDSSQTGINEYYDLCDMHKIFVLSGRTALYLIAEEIKSKTSEVLLPAYCCSSMVAPFVSQGMTVFFYDPFDIDNVRVDGMLQAVLVMDYFGFASNKTYNFAKKCKDAGKIVIVDATQTAFSNLATYGIADFVFASYRKWFDCLCATIYSKNGFKELKIDNENLRYQSIWRTAARLKKQYIKNAVGDKSEFLALYSEANRILNEDYEKYAAEIAETDRLNKVDSLFLKNRRRSNAEYLINEIKKHSEDFGIRLLFDTVGQEDCPLFVPVLIDEKIRSEIRNELIRHDVYCPIHWPIDKRYPYVETMLHRTELSLICDQRYGIDEMKRQITVLINALSLHKRNLSRQFVNI